jgi:oligopeptide/dipeptide ABC transporter ATP-binding protein
VIMTQDLTPAPPAGARPLLEIEDLSVVFRKSRRAQPVYAVDGVDLTIAEGETVGLVGESGSGKTTLGQAVLGLVEPTSGAIRFDGVDITHANRSTRRALSSEMQVVFQNPYGSLSPTRTIGQTLLEPLLAHGRVSRDEGNEKVAEMLRRVGLPVDTMLRRPSEFSGGQRQRVAVARALMMSPRFVVCDEAVSALDLSVQAQILNLLGGLQREFGLSYLFVSHNLAVVRHMSQRIVVLYRGRVMESGPAESVYSAPAHPYTQALLQGAPVALTEGKSVVRSARVAASTAAAPPTGGEHCPFVTRCPYAVKACGEVRPPLVATASGTQAACIRIGEIPVGAAGLPPAGIDGTRAGTAGGEEGTTV